MQTLWLKSNKERKPTSSKFSGVMWHKTKKLWRASVSHHGTKITLGYYTNEVDAARAVNFAQVKYNGQFARLNILPEGE